MNKSIIFIVLSLLLLSINTLKAQHVREVQDQHDLFGVSGQWTGDECNSACTAAKGTVCGVVWK